MINTIVLDLDGTLLNSDKKISPKTKEVLLEAQKQGMRVILASGRPTPAMLHLADELELNKYHGLVISFNGAHVIDYESKEVLYSQVVDPNLAPKLFDHLSEFDVIPMIANDNYMYVNNVYNMMINPRSHIENDGSLMNIIEYESRAGNYKLREMENFAKEVDFELHKVLVAGDPQYLLDNAEALTKVFEGKMNMVFSAPFFLEFTDYGVDKANTLDITLNNIGLSRDSVIAFGDGHNDKTLLEYAKIGVAMDNAEDAVKAIADEITLSNDHDGIAHIIKRYLK